VLAALCSYAAACGSDPAGDDSGRPDSWHVRSGFVRDADGRAIILRGANLANQHKQAPYLGFHQPADFQDLRQVWGMNAIRYLLTWSAVEPQDGQFDDAYLEAVAQRMDWAHEAGLLVVLDMHQDVYGEGFGGDGAPKWTCDQAHYDAYEPQSPWFLNYLNEHVAACFDDLWTSEALGHRFAAAWAHVAARLGDHPAVVGFDVLNEPHWGTAIPGSFERDWLQPFYERVVPAVRGQAPNWVAFLEPSAGRNVGIATSLTSFPFSNVAYAPHSYDASAEQGNGFNPVSRGAILANYESLAEEARSLDAALWIGEYGGIADDDGIVAYMDAQYDGAAAVAAGTMYWSYDRDNGYGMLRPEGAAKEVLLDVLVRPYPQRVAGRPLSWSFDEETRTFILRFEPDRSIAAPTILAVPSRVYPNGYEVECDGCEHTSDSVDLWVTTPPEGSPAEIVVRPAGTR
jgi:endoglycosylceramidase